MFCYTEFATPSRLFIMGHIAIVLFNFSLDGHKDYPYDKMWMQCSFFVSSWKTCTAFKTYGKLL